MREKGEGREGALVLVFNDHAVCLVSGHILDIGQKQLKFRVDHTQVVVAVAAFYVGVVLNIQLARDAILDLGEGDDAVEKPLRCVRVYQRVFALHGQNIAVVLAAYPFLAHACEQGTVLGRGEAKALVFHEVDVARREALFEAFEALLVLSVRRKEIPF